MSIKAILFDLDGTLLPMNMQVFFKEYFKFLAIKLAPLGYDKQTLIQNIWQGVDRVCVNDGSKTNEEVFWDFFASAYGEKAKEHKPIIDRFYLEEFEQVKEVCGFDPMANETVKMLKSMGYRLILATQPIFPYQAILKRIEWAGVDVSDFEYVTSYEKCKYSKPETEYYEEIAEKIGLSATECLMIGNDVYDDMPAEKCGMKVFLLTNNLINKENRDISKYPQGNFDDLIKYVNELK